MKGGSVHVVDLTKSYGDVPAVRGINRYLEIKQPWTLAKQEDKAPLRATLYPAAEALRVAAALLVDSVTNLLR